MSIPKPQQYKTRVSDKYYLTENEKYVLVKLELVEPKRIEFQAGQYVSIKINEEGERRSYSIASTPDVEHGVTMVVKMTEGKGGEFLRKLEIGEMVELMGPMGRFVICGDPPLPKATEGHGWNRKLLFVATGSGIVPVKAMIEDLLINKRELGQIRLHWGMRSESDLFWFDNLERLTEEYPNFVFDQVLSQPGEEWSLCIGHVQDCLVRDFSKGMSEWEGYVCGNPEMVDEVRGVLVKLGMDSKNIFQEKY